MVTALGQYPTEGLAARTMSVVFPMAEDLKIVEKTSALSCK
jgi:hypothetical protein